MTCLIGIGILIWHLECEDIEIFCLRYAKVKLNSASVWRDDGQCTQGLTLYIVLSDHFYKHPVRPSNLQPVFHLSTTLGKRVHNHYRPCHNNQHFPIS